MSKFKILVTSKTNWLILLGFLVNVLPIVAEHVSGEWKEIITAILGGIAIYRHTNARVELDEASN